MVDPHEDELELPPIEDGDDAPVGDPDLGVFEVGKEDDKDLADDRELGGSLDEYSRELDRNEDEKWSDGSDDAGAAVSDDEAPSELSGVSLLGDDDPLGVDGEDFGIADTKDSAIDAGDEGFEGDEDIAFGALPDLDSDEEGDLDEALELPIAPLVAAAEDSVLWDDRGWDRALGPIHVGSVAQMWLEGGAIHALVTGDEIVVVDLAGAVVRRGPKEIVPPEPSRRRVPAIARSSVEVSYASGAVGAVRESAEERTWLVRSSPAGPRIVADITDDAGDERAEVMAIVVEPTRGCVWVGGNFGLMAYRPPKQG